MNPVNNEFDYGSIPGVCRVENHLYVFNDLSLRPLKKQLGIEGYELYNLLSRANSKAYDDRNFGPRAAKGLTFRNDLDKARKPLWEALLKTETIFRCNNCDEKFQYVPMMGGQKCEHCKRSLWYAVARDAKVRFRFKPHKPHQRADVDITMYAHLHYPDKGKLYLYDRVYPGKKLKSKSEALAYFNQHSDKWKRVKKDDRSLIEVTYFTTAGVHDGPYIYVFSINKDYKNYRKLKVWNGEEYLEGELPITEQFEIFEAWRWPAEEINKILAKRVG